MPGDSLTQNPTSAKESRKPFTSFELKNEKNIFSFCNQSLKIGNYQWILKRNNNMR